MARINNGSIGDQAEGKSEEVRERLLDSAEKLFAENGFARTSIRKITSSAGCNIAAVNYHFGSKDNLYREVFRRRLGLMRELRMTSVQEVMSGAYGEITMENLFHSFSHAFLEPMTGESARRDFMKLMMREMLDKHLPMELFCEELINPTISMMTEALIRICPGLSEEAAVMSVMSVVAQLIQIIRVNSFLEESIDHEKVPMFEVDAAVGHIVKFSAAGVRACIEEDER